MSAFAESRHSHGTSGGGSFSRGGSSTRSSDRGSTPRSFDRGSRSNDSRSFDRGSRSNDSRSFDRGNRSNDTRPFDRGNRSNDNRPFDRGNRSYDNRSYDRGNRSYDNRSYDRGRSYAPSYRGGRAPYYAHGRVSRYEPWHGGFRVWLGGVAYPFFIPAAHIHLFPRLFIGLNINLGGYYNPLGYYDYYYDEPAYVGGPPAPFYGSGELRGVVESVDFRLGTVLVHDTASNRFVRVELRGSDGRFEDLHIGDYVELAGDWTRIGDFQAYTVAALDPAGYRYR